MGSDNGRVYDAIRNLIASGMFRGGEPLRESKLAELVGVSRTPVREALKRLAAEGIVELRPNRGAQLVAISSEETQAIFDVRCLLEPYLASRAASRVNDAQLMRMQELVEAMEETVSSDADRLDELAALNNEFHGQIIGAADARLAAGALAMAVRPPLVQRTFHRYSPEQLHRSQNHHRELLAAMRAGSPSWAEAVMRSHIEAARSIHL
jgi:DNA-binding GntR family transcriptional regulator